jgi:hypothetical protein
MEPTDLALHGLNGLLTTVNEQQTVNAATNAPEVTALSS